MTTGTYSYSYTYNALGQRTQRSFNYFRGTQNSQVLIGETKSEVRTYTYDQSGRLIEEGISNEYYDEPGTSETLVYLYDERGVVGVNHTSSGETNTYYYQRNLFGDVIGIYDVNGNCVARYVYDAWGNCSMTHSTKSIATRNPFRYRGYYYDPDTGLYYLNSRYYYPEWRRFISPDDTSYLDPETPNGLNLYTYCNNDPVNYCDPSGHSVSLILGLIGLGLGVGLGLGYATYTDYRDDNHINGSVGWQTYVGSAMIGGAVGFGIGYFWPSIASFLGSSFSFALPTLRLLSTGETLALAGGTTITVTGAQIVGGTIALATGLGIMLLASDHRAGNNRVQNKQIKDAIRKAGYDPNDPRVKDQINKMESYIRRHNLDYGWKKLLDFVKRWLG